MLCDVPDPFGQIDQYIEVEEGLTSKPVHKQGPRRSGLSLRGDELRNQVGGCKRHHAGALGLEAVGALKIAGKSQRNSEVEAPIEPFIVIGGSQFEKFISSLVD
jgi:hypothetical protein